MFEEVLAEQNPHWTGVKYDPGVTRTCFSKLVDFFATGQVIAVTGVRRSGKSTLIKQFINHKMEEGFPAANILFLNLEHPSLSLYREDVANLQRIYEDYLKLMRPIGNLIICLDEIQFFRDWPVFVKALHETKKAQFIVTGSNANMLSSDMITMLSGRSLPLEVFPFSYREIAHAQGIDVDNPVARARDVPRFRNLLEEMLEFGGFPSVVLQESNQTAFDILGAHARTVLLQDVVPRLGIRKPSDLEQLYVYMVTNIGKLFSYSNISKLFGLSDKSVKEYLLALSDAHLIYEIEQFSYSLKAQIRNPKKIYAIDTGQANAIGFRFSANRGRLLENLIFIDFCRLDLKPYYFKTTKGLEIDFVIKNKGELALVQIAWDVNDPSTLDREQKALLEAQEELGCKNAILITAEPILPQKALCEGIRLIQAHQFLMHNQKDRLEFLFGS